MAARSMSTPTVTPTAMAIFVPEPMPELELGVGSWPDGDEPVSPGGELPPELVRDDPGPLDPDPVADPDPEVDPDPGPGAWPVVPGVERAVGR